MMVVKFTKLQPSCKLLFDQRRLHRILTRIRLCLLQIQHFVLRLNLTLSVKKCLHYSRMGKVDIQTRDPTNLAILQS